MADQDLKKIRPDPGADTEHEGTQMARVALVTGGTRGIGEAISRTLKDQGLIADDVPAAVKRERRRRLMSSQRRLVRRQRQVTGQREPGQGAADGSRRRPARPVRSERRMSCMAWR